MAKTPKKRIKKVTRLSICTYCLDADRSCLCRLQSKKHDHICLSCKTNYLLGHCEICLERTDSRRMKWDQTFSETEIRLLKIYEQKKRPNPYQPESSNQRQLQEMADTDSGSKDLNGSSDSSESEESRYGEHEDDPDNVLINQPVQGSTVLGNREYIINNRSWMDNFLLRDYLNLEQDVYWKIMIIQTMIQDKQDWIEIKRALRDITSNYIELYQLNQILWCITEGDEKLTDFLEKKDKIDELRLIHNIKETLKKFKFTIIYDQCIEAEI